MARWMAALVLSLLFLSSVHASLDRKRRLAEDSLLPYKSRLALSAVAAKNDDYRITAKTEVLLDGRPCRYEQVPDGATIILLETLTNESKEITRIHFRSPRRSAKSASK